MGCTAGRAPMTFLDSERHHLTTRLTPCTPRNRFYLRSTFDSWLVPRWCFRNWAGITLTMRSPYVRSTGRSVGWNDDARPARWVVSNGLHAAGCPLTSGLNSIAHDGLMNLAQRRSRSPRYAYIWSVRSHTV